MSSPARESVTVLEECIDLQKRKSQDYQNPNSNIKQAMHYRRGVSTIHDMIQQKLYRAQSLLEPMENGDVLEPNFESLEDTYKDAINYLSFAVSYIRGRMEGQDRRRDMLNRPLHEGHAQMDEMVLDTKYTSPQAAELAAVVETYRAEVAPIGRIPYPEEKPDATIHDSITETYTRVRDVGDRIEENFS